jgi:hypothetical protein
MLTTSAHPLELGANNITGLTIATDGKVELDVVGTAVNHLIDKAYVDAAAGGTVAEADFTHTQAVTGSIHIPTSTGTDLVLNWGKEATILSGGVGNTVTFNEAFANAFFVGFATADTVANHDGCIHVVSPTLSNMIVRSSTGKTTGAYWIAIGY